MCGECSELVTYSALVPETSMAAEYYSYYYRRFHTCASHGMPAVVVVISSVKDIKRIFFVKGST